MTLVDAAMAKTPIDPHTYDHTYCIREGYVLSCCFSVSLVFVFFFVCPASFFLLRFSASMLLCFSASLLIPVFLLPKPKQPEERTI